MDKKYIFKCYKLLGPLTAQYIVLKQSKGPLSRHLPTFPPIYQKGSGSSGVTQSVV